MKSNRVFLFVAVPALALLGAWGVTARLLRPSAPVAAPRAAPIAPRAVERLPIVEPRPAAALAPKAAAATPKTDEGARWIELNNTATQALTGGDVAGAVADFERCLAGEPQDPIFAGNLAEALVRLARQEHDAGKLADAIAHLARAIDLAPTRADIDVLRQILARWRTELELGDDDWTDDSSHFELSFDKDRGDILHRSHEVLEHLEETYQDLVRWFGTDPFANGPRIRVVLYRRDDFDRMTGLGDWAAGVFDGVVRVSLEDLAAGQSWRAVLVHELVHAFVQAVGGTSVPGWLNEGLAQLLEHRPDAVPRLRERLRGEELFPLERLAGTLASWHDTSEIGRAYAESLVFVDYLRTTYGEETFRRMLAGLSGGETAAAAFESWTSVPLAIAFQDWSAALAH